MKSAVIIGRFQPLHNGHWQAITSIAKRCENLIVIIGTPTTKATISKHNPLTTLERSSLLRTMLKTLPISHKILVQRDVGIDTIWREEMLAKIPRDALICSGNTYLLSLFRGERSVHRILKKQKTSGTGIRAMMRKRDPRWRKLVPQRTLALLDSFGIAKRV